ncbi:hypothetical protein GCM10009743_67900 [Kribbella swartbergensis]
MPDFFFCGTLDINTTIEAQLGTVEQMPSEYLKMDIGSVWRDARMPTELQTVLKDRSAPARVADALYAYWKAAVLPHWETIRSGLDDDVAYRAQRLAKLPFSGLFDDIHPEVDVKDEMLVIDKPGWRSTVSSYELAGQNLRLVPSAFAWPRVGFAVTFDERPILIYPVRRVDLLWGGEPYTAEDGDALSSLIGRSRAAILRRLAVARSTTELAVELNRRPSAVSQHLSVLRRSGLALAHRKGKSVLYRQTSLAEHIVNATSFGPAQTGTSSM